MTRPCPYRDAGVWNNVARCIFIWSNHTTRAIGVPWEGRPLARYSPNPVAKTRWSGTRLVGQEQALPVSKMSKGVRHVRSRPPVEGAFGQCRCACRIPADAELEAVARQSRVSRTGRRHLHQ